MRGLGLDGPCRLADGTLAWFDPSSLVGLDASTEIVRQAISEARVGDTRVVVVGASQGAAAAMAAVGPAGSPAVDQLVCWSGFAVEGPGHELDLGGLDGVELLVIHGDADEVVPVWMADDLVALATMSGAAVTTHILAGGGHDRTASATALVSNWILGEEHA